jgi:hypothetical protein
MMPKQSLFRRSSCQSGFLRQNITQGGKNV